MRLRTSSRRFLIFNGSLNSFGSVYSIPFLPAILLSPLFLFSSVYFPPRFYSIFLSHATHVAYVDKARGLCTLCRVCHMCTVPLPVGRFVSASCPRQAPPWNDRHSVPLIILEGIYALQGSNCPRTNFLRPFQSFQREYSVSCYGSSTEALNCFINLDTRLVRCLSGYS